jgi:predicted metal-binding protein
MADQPLLQKMFMSHGFRDFRWINPAEIVVAKWVRMKCTFGCDSYGRNVSMLMLIGKCRAAQA